MLIKISVRNFWPIVGTFMIVCAIDLLFVIYLHYNTVMLSPFMLNMDLKAFYITIGIEAGVGIILMTWINAAIFLITKRRS